MSLDSTDGNKEQAVRKALTPLKQFAERSNVAVVMVRHLNKSGGRSAMYRGSGSIGINAAVRSAMLVGKSPKDSEMRVVAHYKCNLGPLAPSLLFEPMTTNGSVKMECRGTCDLTADDLLVPPKNGNKLEAAIDFLFKALADGPVLQSQVKKKAQGAGIAWRTVERGKEALGVVSQREGWGPGSKCYWRLADDS